MDLELMSTKDICDWLKYDSGKLFDESLLSAISENDLDGEALVAALGQGPECLKEAIPSLAKRLKLLGALQVLQASSASSSRPITPGTSSAGSIGGSDHYADSNDGPAHCSEIETASLHLTPQSLSSTPNRTIKVGGKSLCVADMTCNKIQGSNHDFKLPIFRSQTQKNLEAERLPQRDRCYVVRTLATMLLSSNPNPSISECSIPAKVLVDTYPFLADASEDAKEPYYSWTKFISQRCANVNRSEEDEGPKPKKRKTTDTTAGKHQYMEDFKSIIVEDTVAYNRVMKRLSSELLKPHPVPQVLEDLMTQSYPNRRASILEGDCNVIELCDKFQLLRKPKYISLEFDRITGFTNSMNVFVKEWTEAWIWSIFDVAKEENYLMSEFEDDTDADNVSMEAFKLLVKLVTPKKKKSDDALSHILMSIKSGTPHDEIVGSSNQPMIVWMYDIDNSDNNQYYIMVEQELLQETRNSAEAIFLLLAVHYVYNLEYDPLVQAVLYFLQEYVCKLKDAKVKHTAVYTSVTSRLFRASVKRRQN